MERIISLVKITYTNDGYGKKVATETKRDVYASLQSVSRSEFFSAFQADLRAEYVADMFRYDYEGEDIAEIDNVKYDIYRTYAKKDDKLEIYLTKKNIVPRIATLWTYGKVIKLHNVYFTGDNGITTRNNGKVAADTFTMYIPQNLKAFCGETAVEFIKPKAYAGKTDKTAYWTMDSSCFFAIGDIDTAETTYQAINHSFDDVYKIQSVNFVNNGKVDTEHIEVIGK